MNKESLKEYLSSRYQGWSSFLNNVIFPIFGEDDFENGYETELLESQPERRQLAETTGIRSIKQVGMMYVGVVPLQIFDVTVSDRVMMERNRVNIQRLIRSVMDQYSCAFMLFHYEDDTRWDWRFTYCRKSGNKEETTDSKRYTFLLGPGQSCRTATDNFISLYEKRGSLEIKDIENAFNVEALSKEFFGKYKEQYEKFVKYMSDPVNGMRQDFIDTNFDRTGKSAEKIREQEEKPIRDYVKKLLGRIVFLHFLQKKGWLGIPAGKEWGEGDRDFMFHLFSQASELQKENFLDDILEKLFVDGLDCNRSDRGDVYDTKVEGFRDCRIPYLNGGLFEQDNLDGKPSHFPANYFESLLTMFSQYNFTIDENDPNDAEVGVDPEMLGRIFENLLEDNKDKGAFYTPKEIVQYMCRESLIAYLQTDQKEEDKEYIRKFVITHDAEHLGNLKEVIDQKLREVKICDPAIGSGAFPMGLLRELFFCRSAIEPDIVENAANIKRHIIQNNIYGVDIERGAVDIARLRFWLSLIVDEKSPEQLPNLDFKIMQGNSLLEQYKGVDLSTMTEKKSGTMQNITISIFENMVDVLRKNLRDKLSEYYNCTKHEEKIKLRKEISEIINKLLEKQYYDPAILCELKNLNLAENDKFFLWHTWFNDVFSRPSKEGFDIVIGNPPYGAKISSADKFRLKRVFTSAQTIPGQQKGSLDTFSLFIELGYHLLHLGGNASFIVPLSVTSSDAMSGLHRLLMNHCEDIYVSSYGDRPRRIFESAEQQVSIISFARSHGKLAKRIMTTHINKRYSDESLWLLLDNLKFVNTVHHIRNGRIPKIGEDIELAILKKLESCVTTLKDIYDPSGTPIYYRKAGGRYYKIITKVPTHSSAEGDLKVNSRFQNLVGAALSSNLFYWFWLIHSDWHNLRSSELEMFPIPYKSFSKKDLDRVADLYDAYLNDLYFRSQTTKTGLKCFYARQSKVYIDAIDKFLGLKYGLSDTEIEFLINYDYQYRKDE